MCVLEVAAAEVAAAEARRAAQAAQAELDDPSMANFLIWKRSDLKCLLA